MRFQASLTDSDPLVIEEEYTTTARRCTNIVWIRNAHKDCDIPEEILTPHYDNLKRISIFSHILDVIRYEALYHS